MFEKHIAVSETYGQVKQRIVELEDRLDELDSDIDDVARNVQMIVEKLEDYKQNPVLV